MGTSSAQTHDLRAAGAVDHLQDLGLQDRPFDKAGGTSLFRNQAIHFEIDSGERVLLPPFPPTSTT